MIIFHPLLNSLGAIIQFIKHQSDEDGSWIKRKIYNWFLSNAQSLVLMAIVVFNASGVKEVLLQLFNKIIGAQN